MTLEQALVYLLGGITATFLFLGLAQALEGRSPRRQRATGPVHLRAAVPAPVEIQSPDSGAADIAGATDSAARLDGAAADGAAVASPVAEERDDVAEAHAAAVGRLIGEHDYTGARERVDRAVEAGELPSDRAHVLHELIGVSVRREVQRLTAAAIRGGKDEDAARAGLACAEALLDGLPDGVLGAPHRAAVAARIWQSHARLGFRHLSRGQLDAAADSLYRALAMREVGRRRQRQVRDALVRTLEGLGEERGPAVAALLAEGNETAAALEIARLERRLERAREEGVLPEDLEVAGSKLDQLRRALDPSAAAP